MNLDSMGADFNDMNLAYPQVQGFKLVPCIPFNRVPGATDRNYPNLTLAAYGTGATARVFMRTGSDGTDAVWQEIGITAGGVATVAEGGTGRATLTDHAILVGSGTDPIDFVGPSATVGQVLQSAGAAADPAFSTATYPATTTINQLLYSSSADIIGGLATANNGTLVTSAAGVPSILAGPGTTGQILQSNAAAAPSFSTASYPSVATTAGTFLRADGTNWLASTATLPNTATQGDLLYASSGDTWISLAKNAIQGMVLTNNGASSAPLWQPAPGGIAEGWSNLGVALSGGVLSIVGETGTVISATNPALVKFNSKATPGTIKTITQTTAPVGLTETELTSATFGTTAATEWANAMPFFIYAVLNSSAGVSPETAISFFCSRNPCAQITPATVYKLGTVASVTSQFNFFGFDSAATSADYATSPCVRVGSFRMVKSAGDAWTIQTLGSGVGGQGDGIGNYDENTYWVFPTGQNGAIADKYFNSDDVLDTMPTLGTGAYTYQLGNDGSVDTLMSFTAITVNGVSNATASIRIMIPLENIESNISSPPGYFRMSTTATNVQNAMMCLRDNGGAGNYYNLVNLASATLTAGTFVIATDITGATYSNVSLDITYQAFSGNG